MARQVQGRIPGRVIRAAFYGDSPAGEPVWVTYRVPTEREKRELHVYGDGLSVTADKVVHVDGASVVAQQAHAIRTCVKAVENYNDATGAPIADGPGLAEHGDSDIVRDVFNAIMASVELEDEAAKKSKGSPASDLAATVPLPGIATSAGGRDGTAIATATAEGALSWSESQQG